MSSVFIELTKITEIRVTIVMHAEEAEDVTHWLSSSADQDSAPEVIKDLLAKLQAKLQDKVSSI